MVTRRRVSSQTNGTNGHATSALVAKLDAAVIEQRDKACAELEQALAAVERFLRLHPRLDHEHSTQEQQDALRQLRALLGAR